MASSRKSADRSAAPSTVSPSAATSGAADTREAVTLTPAVGASVGALASRMASDLCTISTALQAAVANDEASEAVAGLAGMVDRVGFLADTLAQAFGQPAVRGRAEQWLFSDRTLADLARLQAGGAR